MVINTYLSTIGSKKQTKQTRKTEVELWDGECFGRCQMVGCGRMGEEVRRFRSTNRQLQNSHGDVQYRIGSGEARELIHMTHGREQWCEDYLREWGMLGGGGQKGKNWGDNCISIINKI